MAAAQARRDTPNRTARQKTPINLRREPHQRMAKVDNLLQSGMKQIVRLFVGYPETRTWAPSALTPVPALGAPY